MASSQYASGIYCIENIANGRKYVGSALTIANRWKQHRRQLVENRHHSRFLQRAWNKYGELSFSFKVLLYCDKQNLLTYEQTLIDAWHPDYNICPTAGSQLGYRHSPQSRRRMSESNNRTGNPGYRHTEKSKIQIAENRKGKGGGPRSPERCAKISAALRGRPVSQEIRAMISKALTGRKQSAETIEKRALKLRGSKMPEGFAERASLRMKGMKFSPAHCMSIGKSKAKLTDQQVIEVRMRRENGELRKSLCNAFGISLCSLTKILNHTAYKWVT